MTGSVLVADDGNTNRRGLKNGSGAVNVDPGTKESNPETIVIGHGSTDGWLTRLVDSRLGLDLSADPHVNMARSFECFSKGLNARTPGSQAGCRNRPGHISAGSAIIIEATVANTGGPDDVHYSIVGVTM